MTEPEDFNTRIIREFRENGGKVGGPFEGAPLLLLHTTGARSGTQRVSPVMYGRDGANYVVFASKGGAPTNPAWYHNLVANPEVSAEVGTQTLRFTARIADGDERERIWAPWKTANPGFADYEAKTSRQIPVVILQPAS